MKPGNRIQVIVPAAGIGSRMQADRPKQYLPLLNKPLIQHTLERLLHSELTKQVTVAIADNDPYWRDVESAVTVTTVQGGKDRVDSVYNALRALQQQGCSDDEWVLVHDAARPCITSSDIYKLVTTVQQTDCDGGLLGMQVRDTMKRTTAAAQVIETVSRDALWHALTPQMARLGALTTAIVQARQSIDVTDEASALEWAGYSILMVEGRDDNIKVTRPQDLALASYFIQQQKQQGLC